MNAPDGSAPEYVGSQFSFFLLFGASSSPILKPNTPRVTQPRPRPRLTAMFSAGALKMQKLILRSTLGPIRFCFRTAKTHSGPQPGQNPALQHAPNALQNGTSLLGRPPRMPRHQPRGARSGITHCALWITSKNSCRGLTAPNGGIRSASSIGTIVCSSAVVVGQRFERGVP
jgi:hypothetical protein